MPPGVGQQRAAREPDSPGTDEEREEVRVELIRGNLKLINQIMQLRTDKQSAHLSSVFGHSRTSSTYLPLPNHNFNQAAQHQAGHTIQAKTSLYQIEKAQTTGHHVRSSTYHADQAGALLSQTEEERQRKLSINKKTLGERMQHDYLRMARAQESLVRESERALVLGSLRRAQAARFTAGQKAPGGVTVQQPLIREDRRPQTSELDGQIRNEGVSTRRRPVRSGYTHRLGAAATTETLKGAVDLEDRSNGHSNKLQTGATGHQTKFLASSVGRDDGSLSKDPSNPNYGEFRQP